jgi:NTE family protein
MKKQIFFLVYFLFVSCFQIFSQEISQNQNFPKIGLVLSGGGAKGLAHIGVLKVLEKNGIPIDYIGGTSMGAIVGALYAIGYDSETLETIIKELDWEEILSDNISRKMLSMNEKENDGRYFLTLPIKNRKIQLPSGIVPGQNIMKIFSRLTWKVHSINDFSKFNVPFICITADIEKGKSVTLTGGFLPDALRASMSIPSLFTPIEINGKLCVDGGLINNLPSSEVKDLGADIIIAVDVQDPYYEKKDLNSFMKIMEQSGKFLRAPYNEKNRKLANILIKPPIPLDYSILSFDRCDSAILYGELATNELIDSIKKIIGNRISPMRQKTKLFTSLDDSVFISDINLEGLDRVSHILVYGKLNIHPPEKSTLRKIEESIDRTYGTQFFERVTYRLDPEDNGYRLTVRVLEKTNFLFRVGLHYDNNLKAGILFNTTFRNVYKNGSLLSLDVRLSENPELSISYFVEKGWKPGLAARLTTNSMEINQFNGHNKIARYTYSEMVFDIGTQSTIFNSYALRLGAQTELSSLISRVSPIELENIDTRLINFYGSLKMDTYDRVVYPRKGFQLHAETKLITDYESYRKSKYISPVLFFMLKYNQVNQLSKKVAFISGLTLGSVKGDSIPLTYNCFLGGLGQNYTKGLIPFAGLKMMQRSAENALVGRLDIRYEFAHNHFLSLKSNVGKLTNKVSELYLFDKFIYGFGLTYGYNTYLGPLELTLMTSTEDPVLQTYVNIGFWF